MGSGIATALLLGNIQVLLKEVNAEFLSKGLTTVQGIFISLASILFFSLSSLNEEEERKKLYLII